MNGMEQSKEGRKGRQEMELPSLFDVLLSFSPSPLSTVPPPLSPHSISLSSVPTTCPLRFLWSLRLCSVFLHVPHLPWLTESGPGRDSRERFQWASTMRAWFPEIRNADRLLTLRGYFVIFWKVK